MTYRMEMLMQRLFDKMLFFGMQEISYKLHPVLHLVR